MAVCMDGGYRSDQDHQHYIRGSQTEDLCRSSYDYEQGDRRAAFHASIDINSSSAYIHGNPDMFSGDICGCSGRTFHKDRKGGLNKRISLLILGDEERWTEYGSNSWAYTKLGHIDQAQEEMEKLLGQEDVEIQLGWEE